MTGKRVLMEPHAHTKESSDCGRLTGEELVAALFESGVRAAVITDHYLPGQRQDQAAREAFLTGYRAARAAGETRGLVILPGMEIRFKDRMEDFLVYGMEEEDILTLPGDVCEKDLQSFYGLACERGWRVYQAHPFRKKNLPAHPAFVHGMEIFNGNPRHNSQNRLATKFATLHSLATIAGSDVHRIGDAGIVGLLVPEDALSPKGFAAWLAQTPSPRIQYQEQALNGIRYVTGAIPAEWMLHDLYADAGWTSYCAAMEESMCGIRNSTRIVTAWDDTSLVGMGRVISDGYTISYVQDLIVKGTFHRRGIGRELLRRLLLPYRNVRQTVLITDDLPGTRAFYKACGFENIDRLGCTGYIRVAGR